MFILTLKFALKCLRLTTQQITLDIIKFSVEHVKKNVLRCRKSCFICTSWYCYLPSCFPCMILARKAHIRTFFSCSPFTDGLWDIPTNEQNNHILKERHSSWFFLSDSSNITYSETPIVALFTLNIVSTVDSTFCHGLYSTGEQFLKFKHYIRYTSQQRCR